MLVVVLLLDSNNNNNNHNNILRSIIGQERKVQGLCVELEVRQKRLQVQCTNFGIGVLLVFFCAHVPGCVIGRYFGSSGDDLEDPYLCVLPSSICRFLDLMPCKCGTE